MNLIPKALEIAENAHREDTWKSTIRPMVYHPMGVASLVLRHGGNGNQAAAAILHDAYGKPGVDATFIKTTFNSEVLEILEGFVDPPEGGKKAYLAKIENLPEEVLFVILCEELHEIGELVQDLKNEGAKVWKRYAVPDRDVTWYFRKTTEIAYKRFTGKKDFLVQEMSRYTRALTNYVHEGIEI